MPFLGEALKLLKAPFAFTIDRTRKHGNIWKTRILGDTVVFFVGPKAFSFFMNPDNFTRQNGSPKFLQELLHPDAVLLDGDRFTTRKKLLLSAFTDQALDSYLPNITRSSCATSSFMTTSDSRRFPISTQLAFDVADMLFANADPNARMRHACDFTDEQGRVLATVNMPFCVRQGRQGA